MNVNTFNGTLDEVGIFNEALSEKTINEIMTNGLQDCVGDCAFGETRSGMGRDKSAGMNRRFKLDFVHL